MAFSGTQKVVCVHHEKKEYAYLDSYPIDLKLRKGDDAVCREKIKNYLNKIRCEL
jgi:hypothetical protein